MGKKEYLIVALLCAVFVALFFWGRDKFPAAVEEKTFFSGILAYGEKSRCGLIKVLVMDQKSCSLPSDFCANNRNLLDRRVRIAGTRINCQFRHDLACSSKADFYEDNFQPTECYADIELVKVLE